MCSWQISDIRKVCIIFKFKTTRINRFQDMSDFKISYADMFTTNINKLWIINDINKSVVY